MVTTHRSGRTRKWNRHRHGDAQENSHSAELHHGLFTVDHQESGYGEVHAQPNSHGDGMVKLSLPFHWGERRLEDGTHAREGRRLTTHHKAQEGHWACLRIEKGQWWVTGSWRVSRPEGRSGATKGERWGMGKSRQEARRWQEQGHVKCLRWHVVLR